MSNENGMTLARIDKTAIAKLDAAASAALQVHGITEHFARTFALAGAMETLRAALTPEVMREIMSLQGTRLGFRTDKDSSGGYPVETVKTCLLETSLIGLYPCGNQWNIIAGNSYVTKEGYTFLLNGLRRERGLAYTVIPGIPRVSTGGALVKVAVSWQMPGGKQESVELEFACKGFGDKTGADAYQGKAERKAKRWLFHHLTGIDAGDGDCDDIRTGAIDTTARPVEPQPSGASFGPAGEVTP